MLKRTLPILLMFSWANIIQAESSSNEAASFERAMSEEFQPNLQAHSASLQAGANSNTGSMGMGFTLSWNHIWAWRGTSYIALDTANYGNGSIGYEASYIASSALLFRAPVLYKDLLRPYATYELSLWVHFPGSTVWLSYSIRGGLEAYLTSRLSTFIELGPAFAIYRQDGAPAQSGVTALIGTRYFFKK